MLVESAKIKKTILFKEKTEGGLNLTNIKIYGKSVKFQWLYKLYNEDYRGGSRISSWGGGALKKIIFFPIAEGGAKMFGVFRLKNHDFVPKNHIFSNFRGGARPWIRPWITMHFGNI